MLAPKALSNNECDEIIKEIKNSDAFDDLIQGGRNRINKGSKISKIFKKVKNFKKVI